MKDLLVFWAMEIAVLLAILGVLMVAQQWDDADAQRIQILWSAHK